MGFVETVIAAVMAGLIVIIIAGLPRYKARIKSILRRCYIKVVCGCLGYHKDVDIDYHSDSISLPDMAAGHCPIKKCIRCGRKVYP